MNTELVDINHMRSEKGLLKFTKMQGSGDDYIFFNNQCGIITCPESLSIEFSDRHKGIGGDGIVLIEKSVIADARMRIFNMDGSEAVWPATPFAVWASTCTITEWCPKPR